MEVARPFLIVQMRLVSGSMGTPLSWPTGDEAGEHQDAVMRIEKPLRNETPFAPRLPQHGIEGVHALPPWKDLLTSG